VSITNFGVEGVDPPRAGELLLASGDLVEGCLPGDATGWWRVPAGPGGGA
jgi:hypothetical protein